MRRASSVMGASRLYVSDARRRRVEPPSSCKLLAGPKPAKIGPKKLLALQFLERTKNWRGELRELRTQLFCSLAAAPTGLLSKHGNS